MTNPWNAKRSQYRPDSGKELRADGTELDVAAWREDQLQERNGQTTVRQYNPESEEILHQILKELKKINTYLMLMTDEEI